LQPFISSRTAVSRLGLRFAAWIASAVLVLSVYCLSAAQAAPFRVSIVLSGEGDAYREFGDALRHKLSANRFILNTQSYDEKLIDADLYIAVGLNAVSELAAKDASTLNVLVSKDEYDQIQHAPGQHRKSSSAVFLDQPLERQVALVRAALPDIRDVGVLYTARQPELQNLRHLLMAQNMRLHDQKVENSQSLSDALDKLLNVSEVLFVLPDSYIYNAGTIRNILLTAYRKQVSLIGISEAYVRAGALCAVFSSPEQIADQAAGMIQRYVETGKLPPAQYPSEFEVSVNMQVARSLEIQVKNAEQLREAIRRTP
jgi:putative tryptophan/tyrosine transport system substrate-binding protein